MSNQENSEPSTTNATNARTVHREIAGVSVKIPPFWRKNVRVWFFQLEAQFINCGITQELTKYNHLLGAIETDVLDQVSDFVCNPPATNPYSAFKLLLITQFSDSETQKVKKLLTDLELGDKKPTYLLREMRSLSDQQISEDFLRNMFIQRLPTHVKAVLVTSSDPLDKIAAMADKIIDMSPQYQSVAQVSNVDALQIQIEALQRQLAGITSTMSNFVNQDTRRSRSFSRNRRDASKPRSRDPSRHPQCWYHWKFGTAAKRCNEPCSFTKTNSSENHQANH